MLKFSEFITEKDRGPGWSTSKYESRMSGKKKFIQHHSKVDGHDVHVELNGHADEHGKYHHVANYTVDQDYERKGSLDKNTGRKIVHHVGRKIDSMIRHAKPASLSMGSKHDNRIALHHHMAHRLAKKYGGHVEVTDNSHVGGLTRHTVHFK